MDYIFIIAQIFGIIAWLLMAISYYRKNTHKIVFVQLLAIVFYCLNYLFLGAYAGIAIIIFEFIRDYLYYKKNNNSIIFFASLPLYIVLAYFCKDNFIEIIPIAASILEGYTLTKKKGVVVVGALFVYTLWIIYDLEVLSYTGAITDLIIVISNIVILISLIKNNQKSKEFRVYNHRILNDTSFDRILKLDKEMYPKELLWTKEYQKELYNKNKDTFNIIKYHDEVVGYINYLVISKEEYDKILNTQTIDINYSLDDIDKFKKNRLNYIIIDSIVIDEKYDNKKVIDIFNKHIKKYINNKIKEGYLIRDVIAIGITNFEKEVLNKSILTKYKTNKECTIYQLNNHNKI